MWWRGISRGIVCLCGALLLYNNTLKCYEKLERNCNSTVKLRKNKPLRNSNAAQSAVQRQDRVDPRAHSGHHAMAYEDIFYGPARLSSCPPKNLVHFL